MGFALGPRINLLTRNEALFRQDLDKSVETIQRFFDVEKPEVKSCRNKASLRLSRLMRALSSCRRRP